MEIRTANTVQEPVIRKLSRKYKDHDLVVYNITISLLKDLLNNKTINIKEYENATQLISTVHGLENNSIFSAY